MRQVALCFHAHPDDAEMSCAGTLIRLAELGWEVHIATATGGGCGSVEEPHDETVITRTGEAERAAALIGAHYHCLHEPDGRMVYDRAAVDKSIELFRAVVPGLVFAPPPIDYHRDHEVTHQLARAASFVYAALNASARPLLPGSAVPYLYYIHVELHDPSLGPTPPATTAIDVTGQMDRRAEMLACHASQRRWLQVHHGVDNYVEQMRRKAARLGAAHGVAAAEVFVQHRARPYPTDDLLGDLLGNVVNR